MRLPLASKMLFALSLLLFACIIFPGSSHGTKNDHSLQSRSSALDSVDSDPYQAEAFQTSRSTLAHEDRGLRETTRVHARDLDARDDNDHDGAAPPFWRGFSNALKAKGTSFANWLRGLGSKVRGMWDWLRNPKSPAPPGVSDDPSRSPTVPGKPGQDPGHRLPDAEEKGLPRTRPQIEDWVEEHPNDPLKQLDLDQDVTLPLKGKNPATWETSLRTIYEPETWQKAGTNLPRPLLEQYRKIELSSRAAGAGYREEADELRAKSAKLLGAEGEIFQEAQRNAMLDILKVRRVHKNLKKVLQDQIPRAVGDDVWTQKLVRDLAKADVEMERTDRQHDERVTQLQEKFNAQHKEATNLEEQAKLKDVSENKAISHKRVELLKQHWKNEPEKFTAWSKAWAGGFFWDLGTSFGRLRQGLDRIDQGPKNELPNYLTNPDPVLAPPTGADTAPVTPSGTNTHQPTPTNHPSSSVSTTRATPTGTMGSSVADPLPTSGTPVGTITAGSSEVTATVYSTSTATVDVPLTSFITSTNVVTIVPEPVATSTVMVSPNPDNSNEPARPVEVKHNNKGSGLCAELGDFDAKNDEGQNFCELAFLRYIDDQLYTKYTSLTFTQKNALDSFLKIALGPLLSKLSGHTGCTAIFECKSDEGYKTGMTGAQIKGAFYKMYVNDNVGTCGTAYLDNGCNVKLNGCNECKDIDDTKAPSKSASMVARAWRRLERRIDGASSAWVAKKGLGR